MHNSKANFVDCVLSKILKNRIMLFIKELKISVFIGIYYAFLIVSVKKAQLLLHRED